MKSKVPFFRAFLRILILFLACAVPFGCQRPAETHAETRPNILLILTDDQGWGDLSYHGNTNIRTPQLDQLFRTGLSLSQFFVQPVCSPTRAEILTGQFYPRLGVYSTSSGGERMNPEVPTLGTLLQGNGYRTGLFGKWHNGSQPPYHPNFRGFETFYGFTSGHWAHYFDAEVEHNGSLTKAPGYLPDALTSETLKFLSAEDDRPFFAMLCFNTPHSPMQVPDSYWHPMQQRELSMRHRDPEREDLLFTRAALSMVENIDFNVGRILEHLDAQGLDQNTIVVFLSDNGPNSYRWNGGLKGRKGSTDEGGVKSPCLIRWPGKLQAGKTSDILAGSIDLLPTLAGLAGIDLPNATRVDGRDLGAFLRPGGGQKRPDFLYHHWNGKTSLRSQDYRLDAEGRLYHMSADPGQHQDLGDRFPELRDSLDRAKLAWETAVLPRKTPASRPFTVGYPGSGTTYLPARDGTPQGPVERSNQYPNASYFQNWNAEGGTVYWPVDVLTAGRYEAILFYACPEESKGMELQLKARSGQLANRLKAAYTSEVFGWEADRVPRIESYAKTFRPWKIGTIALEKGVDTLWLSAGPFPAGAHLEVGRLALRRVDAETAP